MTTHNQNTYPTRVKSETTEPSLLTRLHKPLLVPALIETGNKLNVDVPRLIDVEQRAPWVGATTIVTLRLPLAGATLLRCHFEELFPDNSFQVLVGDDKPTAETENIDHRLDISHIGTMRFWVFWKPGVGNRARRSYSVEQMERLLGPEDTLTAKELLERCIDQGI